MSTIERSILGERRRELTVLRDVTPDRGDTHSSQAAKRNAGEIHSKVVYATMLYINQDVCTHIILFLNVTDRLKFAEAVWGHEDNFTSWWRVRSARRVTRYLRAGFWCTVGGRTKDKKIVRMPQGWRPPADGWPRCEVLDHSEVYIRLPALHWYRRKDGYLCCLEDSQLDAHEDWEIEELAEVPWRRPPTIEEIREDASPDSRYTWLSEYDYRSKPVFLISFGPPLDS
jgi:hypothetical protein